MDELDQSEKRLKKEIRLWKENIARLRGEKPRLSSITAQDVISVNVDFYKVYQKISQLFYQSPDLHLEPKQIGATLEEPAFYWQQLVNFHLGRHGIDGKRLMDDLLVDVLCPAGLGACKVGYERLQQTVQVPSGQMDPVSGQPLLTSAPKTMWERYYAERISPPKLRIPASFTSTRYDDAPWLGFEFDLDEDRLSRTYGVGKDQLGAYPEDQTLASPNDREFLRSSGRGFEIWYKASLYDPTVTSPDLLRRLVILGRRRDRKIVVHENAPYQQINPQTQMVELGWKKFPIRVLTLRSISDSAYPPSDCTISRAQVDELSMGRTQMVLQRRRNQPLRGFDKNRVDAQTIQRLERGETQGLIPFDGDPNELLKEVASAAFPRENFTFNDVTERDIDRYWGFADNQIGLPATGDQTATEASLVNQATETRFSAERDRVLNFYIEIGDALSAILQLFADDESIARVIGPQGLQQLQTWDRTSVATRYAFTARPDSTVRTNAAEEREIFLRAYNLMANDPNVNRVALLKTLATKFNLDPNQIIQPPPPKPPDPPKINLTFNGADLANPVVLDLLQKYGVQIDPQAVDNLIVGQKAGLIAPPKGKPLTTPTEHGGAVKPVPPISQHDANLTGQMPGPGPM